MFPFYKRKYAAFLSKVDQTAALQEKSILSQIAKNASSDFGRNHAFDKIRSLADFRRNVPIRDYADLKPYFDRVAAGDPSALFSANETILTYGCTSGTTGDPKILPITRSWLNAYQWQWQIWGVKNVMDHPDIIGKRWLQISGPMHVTKTPKGDDVGMVSAITARYQNPIFRLFYAAPATMGDIPDADARTYGLLRLALAENIGFIITITPSNLIQFAQLADQFKEDLIRDLHDGTCRGAWGNTRWPEERLQARARMKHPARARQLEKIVTQTGSLYPRDFWDVVTVACWTGGTVGYAAKNLSKYYGAAAVRELGYISTEGRHTIPIADGTSEGLLVPDGALYEFEDIENEGTVWQAQELQAGRTYSVVLSNAQGLYRYRIGDEVKCTGYVGQSPILEFLQKSGEISDLEGEKITAFQLAYAIGKAASKGGWPVPIFSALPFKPGSGAPYYIFLIEALPDFEAPNLASDIDDALCALNIMYRLKRSSGALGPARVTYLSSGHWRAAAQRAGTARGTGETQYKHPVLLRQDTAPFTDLARSA